MSKISVRLLTLILPAILYLNESCLNQKKIAEVLYRNSDSMDVVSTHPSRPFLYGYAYSKEECLTYRSILNYYNIKNGDVVADVGAASGWLEGVFSVMVDSVTFYVQDINRIYLNNDQLDAVVKHYSSLRSKPQTNQFKLVIGTKKKTMLPDRFFDKIIINNTFHELSNADHIIQDIKKKLKPGGQVIVFDQMSNAYKITKHGGCNKIASKAGMVMALFSKSDFHLTRMVQPENSLFNYLTFELNREKADAFNQKKSAVEVYIKELDKFNLSEINGNSLATEELALTLKPHLKDILEVYAATEYYLNALGAALKNENKTKEAINVLKANLILFPESADTYSRLGEVYLKNKDYLVALASYQVSLKLNPGNKATTDKIREVDALLHKNKSR